MDGIGPGGSCGAVLSCASLAFRIRIGFRNRISVTGSSTAEPGKGLAALKALWEGHTAALRKKQASMFTGMFASAS